MKVTVGVLVKGKVQGVYYRQSTKEQALQLGVKGYVQNQQDGSVYLVAQGSKEQVYNLINWCKRGPMLLFQKHSGKHRSFTILKSENRFHFFAIN